MHTEYYIENFDSYSEIFKEHANCIAKLMKILDDEIISTGLPPFARTKDLFGVTFDLIYHVDEAYKKKHNITEPDFKVTTYMSEKDVIRAMREAVKEELASNLGSCNADK